MKLSIYSLVLMLFVNLSCKEEETVAPVLLPSNLQVTIDVSTSTEGLVDVTTTAVNANFFSVEFYDLDGVQSFLSNEGTFAYRFYESGTYLLVSRAHVSNIDFIEKRDSIEITITSSTGSGGIPSGGYTTPLTYPGYTLAWQDEFDGTSLSSDWTNEIGTGNGGWGNQESQYYRAENTEVRDGYLVITAKRENFASSAYTSSRIISRGSQSFKFGRIDIRAAMPSGQGLWPALWMLGNNFNTVGWPRCGEIDIMEMVGGAAAAGRGDSYTHGTVHWWNDATNAKADFGGSYRLTNGALADEFHVYTIIWDQNGITWYFDDLQYHAVDITSASLSEFREEFFFIFNVAVGGLWPGSPNSSTVFPQTMAVDYVRVFQQ
jgi:hypothetical protein